MYMSRLREELPAEDQPVTGEGTAHAPAALRAVPEKKDVEKALTVILRVNYRKVCL